MNYITYMINGGELVVNEIFAVHLKIADQTMLSATALQRILPSQSWAKPATFS